MTDFNNQIKKLTEEGYTIIRHLTHNQLDKKSLINHNGNQIEILVENELQLMYISDKYYTKIYDKYGQYVTEIEKRW